jgi:dihydroflavonol-4-reductase
VQALKNGKSGERYILSGTWVTTKEFSEMIAKVTGKKPPTFTAPVWLAKAALPATKLYSKLLRSPPVYTKEAIEVLLKSNPKISGRKAKKELGHTPRSLEETVQDTYDWFKKRGVIL